MFPHKLAPQSATSVFLGYPSSHEGYCCLDINTHQIIISRHVVFDETTFPFANPIISQHGVRNDAALDFLINNDSIRSIVTVLHTVGVELVRTIPSAAPSLADVEQPRARPTPADDD